MYRESKMTEAELSYISQGLGDFSGHSAKFKRQEDKARCWTKVACAVIFILPIGYETYYLLRCHTAERF